MQALDKNKIIDFLNKDISGHQIDGRIMSLFLKQLSLLIKSGLPLDTSLKIIENQKLDKKLTKTLHNINIDLDRGIAVDQAFENNKKSFNPMIVAFIKSGDKSGRLSEVLDELSKYVEEDSKNKAIIKQTMAYPIILLVVTILIVIVVMSFVLPTFQTVFENQNQSLPVSTKVLMGIANFFNIYGPYLLIVLAILALVIILLRRNDNYKLRIDEFSFKNLPFKKLRLLSVEYQFTSLLYILRAGDIGLVQSLYIIRNSFKNTYIKETISEIIYDINIGVSLSRSLANRKIFTPLLISMIKIGEDSGHMLDALAKTSDYYTNDYVFKLRRLSQLAEPVMIIVMSIIVGFVVFSIAIPIFDSVNTVGL